MIFHDRRKAGPDPYLDWKVKLFLVGAVLALLGLASGSSILVGVAILALLLGVGVRFLPKDGGGDGRNREEGKGDEEHPRP